jgi:hypothetical protein
MNHKTLAIVTDAWWPQVNGVVNTLMQTRAALTEPGYQVTLLTPQDYTTLPCPSYPEIRLALWPSPRQPGADRMTVNLAATRDQPPSISSSGSMSTVIASAPGATPASRSSQSSSSS